MFEFLSSLYSSNSDYINGVASAISIIGAFFWVKSRRERAKKKLFFQWVRKERVAAELPDGFSVSVSKGSSEGNSLVTDVITLVNNTDVSLTDQDFAKPIEILKKNTNTVFSNLVVDSNNGSHAVLQERDDAISLYNVYIPRGASLTIYLAHDSAFQKELRGDLKNLPNLEAKTFVRPSDSWQLGLFGIFLLFVFLIFSFQYLSSIANSESDGSGSRSLIDFVPFFMVVGLVPIVVTYLPKKLDPFLRRLFGIPIEEYKHASENITIECESKLRSQERIQTNTLTPFFNE